MFGSPRAWIAFAVIAASAAIYAGWSPWLARFLHLALAAVLGQVAFSAARGAFGLPSLLRDLALAVGLGVVAGGVATVLFQLANGALHGTIYTSTFDLVVGVGFSVAVLVTTVLQRESVAQSSRERQLAELRASALQAQVEPHFLYNTLANVQQLVRANPTAADGMLESLIRYLKSSIPDVRSGRSTLGQELARAEAYLAIMKVRMGDRLRYGITTPDELRGCSVPPLAVMTLVENAVKHGLEKKPGGGTLTVKCEGMGDEVVIRVIDDGLGFGADAGTGTGLENLRERLASLGDRRARLDLTHAQPSGVEATLVLPRG